MINYGPAPWQQTQWDWRAAGNFSFGGAGGGLIVWAAVSGAQGPALMLLMLGGVGLVGAGLGCVWLELGRPLRALHVYLNPRTSWMTREAFAAALLMPTALAAAVAAVLGVPGLQWPAALLALAFLYCQGRMLQAAKGIPAWRAPLTLPLIVFGGLADGGGCLLLLAAPVQLTLPALVLVAIGATLLARALVCRAHRRSLSGQGAPQALAALDSALRWLWLGGTALALAALALAALAGAPLALPLLAGAGVLATGAGAWFKFVLITRAGFNQGFALVHLPIRGARR